jgi:hypothetical protein
MAAISLEEFASALRAKSAGALGIRRLYRFQSFDPSKLAPTWAGEPPLPTLEFSVIRNGDS